MKREDVRIGVGIPSYNHGRYIEETLRSVLQQTWPPDELVVIDDGSRDDSVERIKAVFAEAGPVRCRLVARENRGISETRNQLREELRTDVVALLDSDDRYAPERLERLLSPLPAGEPFFALSGVAFHSHLDEAETAEWSRTYSEVLQLAGTLPTAGFALLRSNFAITASNFVFSQSLWEQVGDFDPRILVAQDWDFLLRAVRYVEPTFQPERLLTYRLHAASTAKNHPDRREEVRLIYSKLAEWLEGAVPNQRAPHPRYWPGYLRYFSGICRNLIDTKAVAGVLPPAFVETDAPLTPVEQQALVRLIAECKEVEQWWEQEGERPLPPHEALLQRCAEAWSASADALAAAPGEAVGA